MDEIEIKKQEILEIIKKRIVEINKEITDETIQNASYEELVQYLELMSKIKDELNLI